MRRCALVLVAALSLAAASSGSAAAGARDVSAYGGLGAWVDVYDRGVWAEPQAAVERMRAHGVATLFVETSSWRKKEAVVTPPALGALLDAAHGVGLRVVAWTLPSFADVRGDLRRATAAIRFRSPTGGRFDSFALDIESPVVRKPALRTSRLLELAAAVRAAAGPELPLGAIVPSPRGLQLARDYWPGLPYRALARTFDVFLPMTYFTYRSGRVDGPRATIERSAEILRSATGDPALPIHAVGGLAGDATPAECRDVVAGALAAGVVGASLYDLVGTTPRQWRELRPLASLAGA